MGNGVWLFQVLGDDEVAEHPKLSSTALLTPSTAISSPHLTHKLPPPPLLPPASVLKPTSPHFFHFPLHQPARPPFLPKPPLRISMSGFRTPVPHHCISHPEARVAEGSGSHTDRGMGRGEEMQACVKGGKQKPSWNRLVFSLMGGREGLGFYGSTV